MQRHWRGKKYLDFVSSSPDRRLVRIGKSTKSRQAVEFSTQPVQSEVEVLELTATYPQQYSLIMYVKKQNMLRGLLVIFFITHFTLHAQNLIMNPGFERIDTSYVLPNPPLDTFDCHNVIGWWNPTMGTTDYYNSDGKHAYCGSRFFQRDMKAHTGNGFGGIYIDHSKWKEYIGVDLDDTLEAGKNYRFSIWLAISPKSKIAVQTLQLEFWDVPWIKIMGYNNDYPRNNPKYPEVIIAGTSRSSMVSAWTQLSVEFTAVGGEVSIVLGYFADYWHSVSLPETAKNRSNDPYCYYYLDDLELIPITGAPIPRGSKTRPIIYFDTDQDLIKKKYYTPLDSVVTMMKQNAHMTVIVNGFTDSVGNIDANMDLSRRRAEAVKKYLVDHGIAESRITTAWYAESRPAGEENAENRRVEFIYKP